VRVTHYYPAALAGEFGTALASRGWASALAGLGHHVQLLYSGTNALDLPPAVDCHAVPHRGESRFRVPVGLESMIVSTDILVLHGGWVWGNVAASRAARRLRVPYVVTAHGVYAPEVVRRRRLRKRAWFQAVEKRHLKNSAAVHLFFRSEVSGLKELGVETNWIISPNGFTLPGHRLWEGQGSDFILWLGRFDVVHKGLDLLLRALAVLPESERPRLVLRGVDHRRGRETVLRLARELGLPGSVDVDGPVYGDEKVALMARAAGFVYPSRWEAFGVAIAEAASMGVPSLVTPYPLGSHLASRRAAILAQASAGSLSDGIRRLLTPSAAVLGRRAREVIRQDFDWHKVASSWAEQVEQVLERARS
jgi:glycosyltransferase involved in cell wall biosynthesis